MPLKDQTKLAKLLLAAAIAVAAAGGATHNVSAPPTPSCYQAIQV